MKASLVLLALAALLPSAQAANQLLVEAESFQDPGGWVLDTQFIEIMGSPYLLAHGLGEPVKDATTTVHVPGARASITSGCARRIGWRDGKRRARRASFRLLVNGKPLAGDLRRRRARSGSGRMAARSRSPSRKSTLALHDLTGFEGRCDAIYFTPGRDAAPPNEGEALAHGARTTLGPAGEADRGRRATISWCAAAATRGIGAAISAARMGCKVALIQDRPVLGGNGSSEVRVWAMGGIRRGLYPNLGEIVEEFVDHAKASPGTQEEFGDDEEGGDRARGEEHLALSQQPRHRGGDARHSSTSPR